jgi:drug/metabolite transporter (DMT)-like permease
MSLGAARAAAVAAAVLFSTGGAAIKIEAFSAAQVSCARSGIAALALYVWVRSGAGVGAGAGSDPDPDRGLTPLSSLAAIGLAYALVLTLFVASTKLTTAANAIFLQATAPIYILALGPWVLGERVSRRDVAYMSILATGLLFCFAGRQTVTAIATNPALGNALAVVCSICWAFTLIGLRWAQRGGREVGVRAVITGNLIACLMALPFAWPFPAATVAGWATLGYLGVIQIAVAYICLTLAMRTLPALEVSLLLLVEPVLNPIWTWVVHGEAPGRWVIVGGAVIISATAVQGIIASRDPSTRSRSPRAESRGD